MMRRFSMLAGLLGVLVVSAESGAQGGRFTLTSPEFKEGTQVPAKFTCDGPDVSPALAWTNPPAGTKSFALIMDDPDAPGGTWLHWVAYDIPAEASSLPEGVPKKESGDRYFFKLMAVDVQTLDLKPGQTLSRVERKLKGRVLGEARLMGTYGR